MGITGKKILKELEGEKNIVVRRNRLGRKIAQDLNTLCIAKLDLESYSQEEVAYLLDLAVADLARFNEYIVRYDSIEIH